METNKLVISPKTKISQLLEAYPQLEDVLISVVPTFTKLKNPVLRKTVAKVATLQQAAGIGSIKVEELINMLRKEVGQDTISLNVDMGYSTEKPAWFSESEVKYELDVREMLAAGEHPVNQVISDLNQLPEEEIYLVIAPFLPAPLIDKASSLNFMHWIQQEKEDLFKIYFKKN
jgi:uncharacterized protein (DUF2249 family)